MGISNKCHLGWELSHTIGVLGVGYNLRCIILNMQSNLECFEMEWSKYSRQVCIKHFKVLKRYLDIWNHHLKT